jgi:hypothetical protein
MVQILFQALTVLAYLAILFRLNVRSRLIWGIALLAAAAFVVLAALMPFGDNFSIDFMLKRRVGEQVWAGRDPYAAEDFRNHEFLNPPSSLPLFALFAVFPYIASRNLFTFLNVAMTLALVPLAQRALWQQDQQDVPGDGSASYQPLPPSSAALIAAMVALSNASLVNLYLGQLCVLNAVFIFAALITQARCQPIQASCWLALATMKVTTMLPFLLLFRRRRDLATWAALIAATLALCLMATRPADLLPRCRELLSRIQELAQPGVVNDISFRGWQHTTLIGLDHLIYRLGIHDMYMARIMQAIALAILGLWLLWLIRPKGMLRPAAGCSLIALYATIFLYHRLYDTVILALPLCYCTGQACSMKSRARWFFTAAAMALVTVLFLDKDWLQTAYEWSVPGGPLARIVQALVLPVATWLILGAMLLIVLGARASCRSHLK